MGVKTICQRRISIPSELRLLRLLIVFLLFHCFDPSSFVFSQTQPTSLYYYAIENVDTGEVVRRDTTTKSGIPLRDLILAPLTNYREWLLEANTGLIGFTDFKTPTSGSQFVIPSIALELPITPDSDQDGLSDDAEFIVGTDPRNPDSDGDGVTDGAAISLGLDPNAGARTGIIASVDTPGTAVDVCAINDVAAIADSNGGISVFNIFNGMEPLIIAQVSTPGSAQRVSCSGNLIGVAGGNNGLSVIDITDPGDAQLIHQISLGSAVQAITTAADIAYVGLNSGKVMAVDLRSGAILDQVSIGSSIIDLIIGGDTLYALTSGQLHAIPINNDLMRVANSVSSPGTVRRIFVGTDTAYVTHSRGYTTYDISNPIQPTLIASSTTTQIDWKQIVVNGSETGVAAVGVGGGTVDVNIYDTSDPTNNDAFVTTFQTPGRAQSVAIYNGLAYVADGNNGMQVINYLSTDFAGQAPSISLRTSFPMESALIGIAEEGKIVRVSADVQDDIQVRNVEFYINDVKVATDGNFPFEYRFITPLRTGNRTSFRLQARASDTGGNFTFSDKITVNLVPDATPPRVIRVIPSSGAILGSVKTVIANFNEPLNPGSVTGTSVQLYLAGPDGSIGTSDDILVTSGTISYQEEQEAVFLSFSEELAQGFYQIRLQSPLADQVGNIIKPAFTSTFRVLGFTDSDLDGVPDDLEVLLGLDAFDNDSDGDGIRDGDEDFDNDGLSNAGEIVLNTDPTNEDTDENGVKDGAEDRDNDRVLDGIEISRGTNPFAIDTDGDQWSDEAEITAESDPLDGASQPLLHLLATPTVSVIVPFVDKTPSTSTPEFGQVVASPVLSIVLPTLQFDDSLGITIAQPLVDVILPALQASESIGSIIAQPPLDVILPFTDTTSPTSTPELGQFVAQPVLSIVLPTLQTSGSVSTTIAQPFVEIILPALEVSDSIGSTIAQPPLSIILPVVQVTEPDEIELTIAQPPIEIEWEGSEPN